jgi:lipid-A-disaccharide synthase
VVFYKTSAVTYAVGKRLVAVQYLSMPNLLLNEPVFPEFVQHEATPERIAAAALSLARDAGLRDLVQSKLKEAVAMLGEPGASNRAASRIADLVVPRM